MLGDYVKNRKAAHDIIFIAVMAAAALVIYAFIRLLSADGEYAVITVDGKEYASKPLNEYAVIDISDGSGYNRIVISDGSAYMEEADCPDRICVKTGRIRKNGETIVCLPHRVVVEIKGGGGDDAVVQ